MGLDATVYCDCLEQNRLRVPPSPKWRVEADETGERLALTSDLDELMAFDDWNFRACEHESGVLVHHHLGNISRVGLLRETLSQESESFPIILNKIIYSGI